MAQTNTDIFWTGVSIAIFGGMNLAAYRARTRHRWDEDGVLNWGGFIIGLVVATPMFSINAPKPFAFISLILFFGTIVHVAYSWVECWPSTIKRRRDAEERSRRNKQELQNADARRLQNQEQQAELVRRRGALNAITVDRNGVTNVAKQIVAELTRANT
jgi:hypothetical protein